MALVYTPEKPEFGTHCVDFTLTSVTDGKKYSLKDFTNGQPLLVMFICNHCPYVIAIEDRLITLGHDLIKEAINIVAICSNDENSYPDDSFENLKKRHIEKKYSFTYLQDKDQSVAKKFGAVCTPDFFLYDSSLKLKYRGRLDDSWKNPDLVTVRELYNAAITLKNKKSIAEQIPSMGCSIKWTK